MFSPNELMRWRTRNILQFVFRPQTFCSIGTKDTFQKHRSSTSRILNTCRLRKSFLSCLREFDRLEKSLTLSGLKFRLEKATYAKAKSVVG